MASAMRAYISGVAGFLGSEVARQMLDLGYEVYGCDNLLTGQRSNVPKGVKWAAISVQEASEQFSLPIDFLIHCAAIARSAWGNNDDLWEQNVRGTMAAVSLARNNGGKIIHISSSVVHVPNSSIYAKTKEVAEQIALSNGAVALRFSNIYGPGQSEEEQEPNVIASMRQQAKETRTVRVDGDGSQCRDFIHVTDAALAVIKAIGSSVPPIWLDVCSGETITILEIANMFGLPIRWAPSRNDPHEIIQDSEYASRWLIGWEPSIALKDGLAEVCNI